MIGLERPDFPRAATWQPFRLRLRPRPSIALGGLTDARLPPMPSAPPEPSEAIQPRKTEEWGEMAGGGSETGEMPRPFTAVAAVHAQ